MIGSTGQTVSVDCGKPGFHFVSVLAPAWSVGETISPAHDMPSRDRESKTFVPTTPEGNNDP